MKKNKTKHKMKNKHETRHHRDKHTMGVAVKICWPNLSGFRIVRPCESLTASSSANNGDTLTSLSNLTTAGFSCAQHACAVKLQSRDPSGSPHQSTIWLTNQPSRCLWPLAVCGQSQAYDEPAASTHFGLEGQVEFKALLYVPSVVRESTGAVRGGRASARSVPLSNLRWGGLWPSVVSLQ